jgi:Concanavalin A-like lectin/glucanases superfamily
MLKPRLLAGIILILLCHEGFGQGSLTNGLVGYFPFNGDANDASGNGNNGTVQGATLTTDRFGLTNSAYYFDGISSRILVPDTFFGPATPGATISMWIKTDAGPYDNPSVLFEKSGTNGTITLNVNSGQVQFGPKLAKSQNWFMAGAPIRSNSLMHLVGVYAKGESVSLYVDGSLADALSVPDDILFLDTSFPLLSAIGIYDFTGGPYDAFRGVIDDVRFYDRALSASEVQALHSLEVGCSPHGATATATVVNGFVVAVNLTDTGCGYTGVPSVRVVGGGGSGAVAIATLNAAGGVSAINVTDAGFGYTSVPNIVIDPPSVIPSIAISVSKLRLSMNVTVGADYVLQSSSDLQTWTALGNVFTATNAVMVQEVSVQNVGQFFRLLQTP